MISFHVNQKLFDYDLSICLYKEIFLQRKEQEKD